jgi:hypothetical protein
VRIVADGSFMRRLLERAFMTTISYYTVSIHSTMCIPQTIERRSVLFCLRKESESFTHSTVDLFQLELCTNKTEKDFIINPLVLEKATFLPRSRELHLEPNAEAGFLKAMYDLFVAAGYPSFSMRDVHGMPTADRLQHQLSALMNFMDFRQDMLPVYDELNRPVSVLCVTL